MPWEQLSSWDEIPPVVRRRVTVRFKSSRVDYDRLLRYDYTRTSQITAVKQYTDERLIFFTFHLFHWQFWKRVQQSDSYMNKCEFPEHAKVEWDVCSTSNDFKRHSFDGNDKPFGGVSLKRLGR